VRKNGFRTVLIGLSGGIDSALTAAIAVDALGRKGVVGVMMPSQYSSKGSIEDSELLAKSLGIRLLKVPITEIFQTYLKTLSSSFKGLKPNVTEENIQARIRGTILMALSNKFEWLVLTTGNKSEMSIGYCTSAELRPNQKDEDSIPPYPVLDPILQAYVEEDKGLEEIAKMGFKESMIKEVINSVDRNEYKRRQSPPGVKITHRALGKDRRLPVTNKYRNF
jgi:NAD+ synthase (glutamine-hydrolysing)